MVGPALEEEGGARDSRRSTRSSASSKRSSATSADSRSHASSRDGGPSGGEVKGLRGLRANSTLSESRRRRSEDLAAYDSEEEWDFLDLRNLFRQVCGACRRRARSAKAAVADAVAHEVEEGWGKTKTAGAVRAMRKTSRSEIRRRGRHLVRQAYEETVGKMHRKTALALSEALKTDGSDGFGVHRFVIHNPGKIEDFFEMADELNVGGTGKTLRGIERATRVARAVKRIEKGDAVDYMRVLREVAILKMIDHPNIIRLFETFEDDRYLYLILEICDGGDLLERLSDPTISHSGCLSEFQASVILRCVLMTLNYMFTNGYAHRDIKPENILFKDKHHDILAASIRLADFGYSRKLAGKGDELMSTKVGSPYYIAPEVLEGSYDKRCDLWSCGVLCYTMLCGYPPFCGKTDSETLHLIQEGRFVFHKQYWQAISKPAKHLIRHLLRKDVGQRISLRRALDHPWIKSRGVVRIERLREETVDRLINFHAHHRLRRCAMLAVAYQLEPQELRGLLELFQGLDLNGDGLLTRSEFQKAVSAIAGVDSALIEQMILSVDAEHNGIIDFTEFVAATLEREMYIKNHAALVRAFRCFDQDDGGSLSVDEVMETLALDESAREEVEESFKEVDTNADGEMDYGEFYTMLQMEPQALRSEDQVLRVRDEVRGAVQDEESASDDAESSDDSSGRASGESEEPESSSGDGSGRESSENEEPKASSGRASRGG